MKNIINKLIKFVYAILLTFSMLVGCTLNKTITQKPVIENSLESDYLYNKYKDLVLYECYVDERGELVDFSYTYGKKYYHSEVNCYVNIKLII